MYAVEIGLIVLYFVAVILIAINVFRDDYNG
jgi:hypothetical protein